MAIGIVTIFCYSVFLRICASRFVIDLAGEWAVKNGNNSIQINGSVPGGIYSDLQNNKILGDFYSRFNDDNYRWVAKELWTYSRNFQLSSNIFNYQHINLLCEGLDTASAVYVNGHLAVISDNMFIRYVAPVKRFLQEGINTIQIQFESPISYAKLLYEIHLIEKYAVPPICPLPVQHGECHANFIRKIQSQFSWDWGPAFPSVGIWKNISIEAYNDAILRDFTVSTNRSESDNEWEIFLQVYLQVDNTHSGQLVVLLDSVEQYNKTLRVVSNDSKEIVLNATFVVTKDVELWWPNGFGAQPLYNITVIYSSLASGETITKSAKIGFRTVELIEEPIPNATGLTFYFRINGKKIFMKGSNWIPADSLPERVTPTYTRRLLQSAKDAHMNILRVWGGGMYETDIFYQIADELGIMLWHDFMFACAMYPVTNNFIKSAATEVFQQIRRLQHHPSILLWSANNENEVALVQNWYQTKSKYDLFKQDYLSLYIDTLKPVVDALDPNRPFLSSSPSNGAQTVKEGWISKDPQSNLYGDIHFYIYSGDTWQSSTYPTPRFISEYGFQSWTSFENLAKISIPEDWTNVSEFYSQRQHHLLGNAEMFMGVIQQMFPPNTTNSNETFINLLYLTQIFQAMSLKTETEHYLRNQETINDKGEGMTMGALYWQLNDIWQCPSWASIEYGGKWKMSHYFAVNFFSPILVSPVEINGTLHIYSIYSVPNPSNNLKLTLMVYQWSSMDPLYTLNVDFTQNGGLTQLILESTVEDLLTTSKCTGREKCFFYFVLSNSSTDVLSTNFHLLSKIRDATGIQVPDLTVKVKNFNEELMKFELEVTTNAVAQFVWLEAWGIEGRFSDNGFLLVNPSKIIDFLSWQNVSSVELESRLKIHSLQNIYE